MLQVLMMTMMILMRLVGSRSAVACCLVGRSSAWPGGFGRSGMTYQQDSGWPGNKMGNYVGENVTENDATFSGCVAV